MECVFLSAKLSVQFIGTIKEEIETAQQKKETKNAVATSSVDSSRTF